jgi:phenylacetate-coenzyme A ligase PaaK-like adenylate-forming protein
MHSQPTDGTFHLHSTLTDDKNFILKRDGSFKAQLNTLMDAQLSYAVQRSIFYAASGYHQFSTANWQAMPLISQETLRAQHLQMVCTSSSNIDRIVTLMSSGTTGDPKRVYFTRSDQADTIQYFKAGMDSFTSPGDKVVIWLPNSRPGSISELLAEALKIGGKQPKCYGVMNHLASAFHQLLDEKPDVVVGIPMQIVALAKYAALMGEQIRVKQVLLSTDSISDTAVSTLESLWHCEVFRYFGMTEMGYGGGIECDMHQGYHLYESDFYIEIIDPETGQPVPDGIWGEMVITTLRRHGMPLIRYRTGDVTRIIPEKCACGSNLKRIDRIRNRVKDVIHLDNGEVLTKNEMDNVLLQLPALLDYHVQYIEGRPQDRLIFTVYCYQHNQHPKEEMLRQLHQISSSQCRAKWTSGT